MSFRLPNPVSPTASTSTERTDREGLTAPIIRMPSSVRGTKELVAERPRAHRFPKFVSDLTRIQQHRPVDIIESASFQAKIEDQSVPALGKLALVNTARIRQHNRSCGRSDMNNFLWTHFPDFSVREIHSTHQSFGQRSGPSIWIVRAFHIDEMRRVQSGLGEIHADLDPTQAP